MIKNLAAVPFSVCCFSFMKEAGSTAHSTVTMCCKAYGRDTRSSTIVTKANWPQSKRKELSV